MIILASNRPSHIADVPELLQFQTRYTHGLDSTHTLQALHGI